MCKLYNIINIIASQDFIFSTIFIRVYILARIFI